MKLPEIDWQKPLPIHIAMDFVHSTKGDGAGKQPNLYGTPKAKYQPYQSDRFVGDTRQGGTCNFGDVFINPHLNGTHTECAGHISRKRYKITDIDTLSPKTALLITVNTVKLSESGEHYLGTNEPNDEVISADSLLKSILKNIDSDEQAPEALIVRAQPNNISKTERDYSKLIAPYFTSEAVELINSYSFKHIYTDLPSLDRTDDGGLLSNHHLYFGYSKGSDSEPKHLDKTITEMIYAPNDIKDGAYILQMNVAQWHLDAAPSYPTLFPIKKKT